MHAGLTDPLCCGKTATRKVMTAASDTHSAARIPLVARGLVSILLVVILPL